MPGTGAEATGIRPAVPADAAVIARVHLASRAATMPYLPPQRFSHADVTRWMRDTVLGACRVWVAVRGEEIVGYAALDGAWLEHLYLRPDVLRQGIGTLLLDEVGGHAAGEIRLHVFRQNTGARAFYARHGFTVVAEGRQNMENLPDLTLSRPPEASGEA